MNGKRSIVAGLVVVAAMALTGCQSRPQLKQVAEDAAEKPINSPEIAAQLREKLEPR